MRPSPNVNLSNLKLQLAEAILKQEGLQDQIKTHDEANGTQTDILHQELDVLKGILDCFSDDYLRRAKAKRFKLDKHKAWKKRRKDRLKAARQAGNRSALSSSMQVQPTISSTPSPTRQQEAKDKEIQQQPQQQGKTRQQQRIQQLTIVVEKLMHIRDLRRRKLEAKGHFFPETGDAFYDRIKSMAATAEHDDDIKEKQQQQPPEHQKTIQPHEQDRWNGNQPLDMDAYAYWLQGWENVTKLRQIRQQWDEYLVDDGTSSSSIGLTTASKIPPTMVSPSPPSSHSWARYLH